MKGNKELRFRASKRIHKILDDLQEDLGLKEKTAVAKLLISLGDDKLKEVVHYVDSITHPLSNNQFEDFFLSLKIRIIQLRNNRNKGQKSLNHL